MNLNPDRISVREKLILAGLFLSKFDTDALVALGVETFTEAFNLVGYGLGSKPASVKNYRDEFDPVFPNKRKGWRGRPIRPHCVKAYEDYESLDCDTFGRFVRSFFGDIDASTEKESTFAKRVATGLAAERYFESVQPSLKDFGFYTVEDTTRLGVGYDFRLTSAAFETFLAVEVKGLSERNGAISLTTKEFEVAGILADRFLLFVVRNFREKPFHDIYRNPLASSLRFSRRERIVVEASWSTNLI